MLSVASVNSTVAYLINRIQSKNHGIQSGLQGFDLALGWKVGMGLYHDLPSCFGAFLHQGLPKGGPHP